jgi:hypothetical protein
MAGVSASSDAADIMLIRDWGAKNGCIVVGDKLRPEDRSSMSKSMYIMCPTGKHGYFISAKDIRMGGPYLIKCGRCLKKSAA